ncbi:MAG: hypothetical protein GH145_02570, partial [Firmicutes bacterium]|nr:hypothetical protein [Bacillota bacterium]
MKLRNLLSYHLAFRIGGIILSIDSDLPLEKETFASKFELFRCHNSRDDGVVIRHDCGLPEIRNSGEKVYHRAPWVIYETSSRYIYKMFVDGDNESPLVAIFNKDHTKGHIYKGEFYTEAFKEGNLTSLLFFPTDQILFARLLADRSGIILHGSGLIFKGKGYLFVGHSDAGKTTLVNLFHHHAKVLNDDRMIVRKEHGRFYLYGTPWHGELSLVAPDRAPLKAVLFLNQAKENKVQKAEDLDAFKRLYECTIKPLVT